YATKHSFSGLLKAYGKLKEDRCSERCRTLSSSPVTSPQLLPRSSIRSRARHSSGTAFQTIAFQDLRRDMQNTSLHRIIPVPTITGGWQISSTILILLPAG